MVEVFAQKNPPLFKLKDLANDNVEGLYKREELTKSEPLQLDHDYFFVEKVIRTKYVKGKKYCLVKYLFYPEKVS